MQRKLVDGGIGLKHAGSASVSVRRSKHRAASEESERASERAECGTWGCGSSRGETWRTARRMLSVYFQVRLSSRRTIFPMALPTSSYTASGPSSPACAAACFPASTASA